MQIYGAKLVNGNISTTLFKIADCLAMMIDGIEYEYLTECED